MSADLISPAILEFVKDGSYPENEEIASNPLQQESIHHLLSELRNEQADVKTEIRKLSQASAPDIDTWISRAKELQVDILRSRNTAREIVAEAEASKALKEKAQDARTKVGLLEAEVEFQEALTGSLEHIKHANGLLDSARDAVVSLDVERAFTQLEDAESSIGALQHVQGSRPYDVLQRRAVDVRESVCAIATQAWQSLVTTDKNARAIRVHVRWVEGQSDLTLERIVPILQGLGLFDNLLAQFIADANRMIVRPCLLPSKDGTVGMIQTTNGISCMTRGESSIRNVFKSLRALIEYFPSTLPPSISPLISEKLMPGLVTLFEEQWLEPAVPLELSSLQEFDTLLADVRTLTDQINACGWSGAGPLREWAQAAPRIWLTKRREALLGEARSLVFAGLRDTKTVERVETQVVSADGDMAKDATNESKHDDDWDTAWDESEDKTEGQDDEADASAWDVGDDDEDTNTTRSGDDVKPENGEEEDEAWGWGDEDAPRQPAGQATAQEGATKLNGVADPEGSTEREITLRETYTVTVIPDNLLETIQRVIEDARTLAGPDFAASPIQPASTALYTLPTLALAIYRATASQAYSRSESGEMFIYNDSNRLADSLRSWQASQPPASRLRLDNDVKALEQFAKAAYSSAMESQRTILRDLADGAQGFSNSTVQPFQAECESAIEQTVDRLRAVHRQWKPVLSQSALLQSLGSLLSTVINKMIAEIEDLEDISEADSKQLKLLCENMASVKDIFSQQMPDGSEGDMTFVYCPSWLKFQYLAEILESSLADIKYLWNEGELSLEFDAAEVIELIEALFAESDIRRRTINEIKRGGRS